MIFGTMKSYAKKIILATITTSLLAVGFSHAAQSVERAFGSEISNSTMNVSAAAQPMQLPCAKGWGKD